MGLLFLFGIPSDVQLSVGARKTAASGQLRRAAQRQNSPFRVPRATLQMVLNPAYFPLWRVSSARLDPELAGLQVQSRRILICGHGETSPVDCDAVLVGVY
jgi:hypothetical protein